MAPGCAGRSAGSRWCGGGRIYRMFIASLSSNTILGFITRPEIFTLIHQCTMRMVQGYGHRYGKQRLMDATTSWLRFQGVNSNLR